MAQPATSTEAPASPLFQERPTQALVPDAWRLGAIPAGVAVVAALLGWTALAWIFAALTGFVAFFFRNPSREIAGDESTVVAPADGHVIDVGEIETEGGKALRIGIFLSVFDVHVNRAPLAGRVVSVERAGDAFLAAFNREAETRNVRCTLTLETESGMRFQVTQITGLVARRIVCHPKVGEWIRRGDRFGLIRFGSRTDVVLPIDATPLVSPRQRVHGGSTAIARLAGAP